MSNARPNKLQQRLVRFRRKFLARRGAGQMVDEQSELLDSTTPPDVSSVRAKSQRHGKSTADKWNQ